MSGPAQGVNPEVRAKFMQMREDIKKVSNTLQDIEAQQSEYRYEYADQIKTQATLKLKTRHSLASNMALAAIEKLPAERKCFRMVGHALVEHTVGEVTPAIKDRRDQLTSLAKGMGEQLDKLEQQASKYALENGLATRAEQPGKEKAQKSDSKGPAGVLV